MLTPDEKAEMRRADMCELRGPITKEDKEFQRCAVLQVNILLRNYNKTVDDEYTTGCHRGRPCVKGKRVS